MADKIDVRYYDESSIPKQSYVGLEADTPSRFRPILLLRALRLRILLQRSRKLALQVARRSWMSGGNPMMEYLKDKWVVLVYLFFYIYGFISFLKDLGLLIPQMVQ
jgi:hypothetical protein